MGLVTLFVSPRPSMGLRSSKRCLWLSKEASWPKQKSQWLTEKAQRLTEKAFWWHRIPVTDKGGLWLSQDIFNTTQQNLWRRGPPTEMGGPLAITGATFANTRGPRLSGGPLADTGGQFSLECYSKGAVFRPCMLKSPIMVDRTCPILNLWTFVCLAELYFSFFPDKSRSLMR